MHANENYQNRNQKIISCTRTIPKTLLASAMSGGLLLLVQPLIATAQASPQPSSWNLPAGPLDQALNRLAEQSKLTISYSPGLVKGKTTRGLSGAHTPIEALRLLLTGTGLTFDALNATTFVLRPAPRPTPTNTKEQTSQAESASRQTPVNLAQVAVTGTRIRGAQPSSPLVMITQDDMRLAGDNDLGDVIRSLPQNFSGGQNPGVLPGTGGDIANQNITGGSSLNLRGLGPDATLTLLNGARLPYDGFSQATDVAVIPIAAIDRMDVLLDGASAIYGSDAVGGVANIVLKRDYNGAELTARTGGATDGGYGQTQVSLVAGNTWSSGGLLLAAETTSDGAVRASQRDYLGYIPNSDQLTIYPKMSQNGVLFSGHQEFGSNAEFTLDAFLTKRSMTETSLYAASGLQNSDTDGTIYGISPSLRITLPHDWSVRINAFDGEDNTVSQATGFSLTTDTQAFVTSTRYSNQTQSADVDFEGALFGLPGGDARMSVGGGWRKSEYNQFDLIEQTPSIEGSQSVRYAYDEVYFPLITESQEIPFVDSLSFNAAARYDDYNSFGGTTTPKLGMLWSLTPSVDVRASWGKSFKAPTLTQLYQAQSATLFTASAVGASGAPSNATVLLRSGGNPNLGPERADVATAGVVIRPSFLPDATIDLGAFDIDYRQRVVNPFSSFVQLAQALNDPAYTTFVTPNPTPNQQAGILQPAIFTNDTGAAYNPRDVIAVIDDRYLNAQSQHVRGLDFDADYSLQELDASWNFNIKGSFITKGDRQLIGVPATEDTVGVVSFPPKFKGQLAARWSRSDFSVSSIVNYLRGIRNTLLTPSPMGSSMTTVDLVFDYAASPNVLDGFGFNLSLTNVFNRRPPFLAPIEPYYVNYDSTNYSALGRVVSFSITKHF
ncbi:TonB-dependent receptor plug domain-containing protein [Dyella monticola]|nr:TonB-dependent receptor [Dyella monticola]